LVVVAAAAAAAAAADDDDDDDNGCISDMVTKLHLVANSASTSSSTS